MRELAADFHSFYNSHKPEGAREVTNARLALVTASRQVLASGLDLLGVSAPGRHVAPESQSEGPTTLRNAE